MGGPTNVHCLTSNCSDLSIVKSCATSLWVRQATLAGCANYVVDVDNVDGGLCDSLSLCYATETE